MEDIVSGINFAAEETLIAVSTTYLNLSRDACYVPVSGFHVMPATCQFLVLLGTNFKFINSSRSLFVIQACTMHRLYVVSV